MIQLKRAYDEATEGDGLRILVERLWPRGLRKADARIDLWPKDVAPSTALRQWYAHDVSRWPEFKRRYGDELRSNPEGVRALRETLRRNPRATFVYAARDDEHNSAVVLRDFVERRRAYRASADCAAARRAMGTRYGEHET
jgi:uncharacterized protein YeaO (DUF488 family)